jgi:hypothetical protein
MKTKAFIYPIPHAVESITALQEINIVVGVETE